ncbi:MULTISPECIES: hypothetical protein [unclassified Pseudomonas]|uniref:hypothetical protein n=1 Tax=unclassified Pseudomonas TaxID=196821 RepID=UPI003DA9C50E
MSTNDDFRFRAHRHLLDVDAATNHLMMLVTAGEVSGVRWAEAAARHQLACDAWAALLASSVQVDPMPAFDGRPTGSQMPMSD